MGEGLISPNSDRREAFIMSPDSKDENDSEFGMKGKTQEIPGNKQGEDGNSSIYEEEAKVV